MNIPVILRMFTKHFLKGGDVETEELSFIQDDKSRENLAVRPVDQASEPRAFSQGSVQGFWAP